MVSRFWRVVASAVFMTLVPLGLVVVEQSQAEAASTLTGISVTVTMNQCPYGAKYGLKKANVHIAVPGTSGVSSGDTVYGLMATYGRNEVDGTNFCQTEWWGGGYYYSWSVVRYIYSNNQRTYV